MMSTCEYDTNSIRTKAADMLLSYRKEHHLSQEKLAEYLANYDISLSTYRRAERGRENVTMTMIIRIFDALKIDISDLPVGKNSVFAARNEERHYPQYWQDNIEQFFYSKTTTPLAEHHYRKLLFLFVLYLPLIPPVSLQDGLYRIGGKIYGDEIYVLEQIQRMINTVPDSLSKRFADTVAARMIHYSDDVIQQDEQCRIFDTDEIRSLHDGTFNTEYSQYINRIRDRFNVEEWIKTFT